MLNTTTKLTLDDFKDVQVIVDPKPEAVMKFLNDYGIKRRSIAFIGDWDDESIALLFQDIAIALQHKVDEYSIENVPQVTNKVGEH